MTEKVLHRSRHNSGLDIQPDMILVRFVCFRLNWVFDPEVSHCSFTIFKIPLGLVDWTLNNVFGMVLPLVQGCF